MKKKTSGEVSKFRNYSIHSNFGKKNDNSFVGGKNWETDDHSSHHKFATHEIFLSAVLKWICPSVFEVLSIVYIFCPALDTPNYIEKNDAEVTND